MTGVVVDTCGWIEVITRGPLAAEFEPTLRQIETVVVPTIVQFELYRWLLREADEGFAQHCMTLLLRGKVVPLIPPLALLAATLSQSHHLAMADAIIYATAHDQGAELLTCDAHFHNLPGVRFLPKRTAD